MGLLSIFQGETALTWRRVRYTRADQAAHALELVRQAGYVLEIRLRHFARRATDDPAAPPVMWLGAAANVWLALDRMAADFGLLFDAASAKPPAPLRGVWIAGALDASGVTEADARLDQAGMRVRAFGPGLKESAQGAAVSLPEPGIGLQAEPGNAFEIPGPASGDSVWAVGDSGLMAPAGLVGDTSAQYALLGPLAVDYLTTGTRPTLIVAGGDGRFSLGLKRAPAIGRALQGGQVVELSILKAGQLGFNPLMDSLSNDNAETLARWLWLFRGTGVDSDHLQLAFDDGVRSLPELAHWLAADRRRVGSLHALKRLADAEQGVVGLWLSGDFDVADHLARGGQLLVDCPQPTGPRLFALRGLLGLAMEADARLLSVGTRWQTGDDPALAWLDAFCSDRRWQVTAFARCSPGLAEKAAGWYRRPDLAEYLRTMPEGVAAVNEGAEWWTVKLPQAG